MRSGHLPPPQLGIISDIDKAIKALARTQAVKERICEYIQQEVNIVPQLRFSPAFGLPSEDKVDIII